MQSLHPQLVEVRAKRWPLWQQLAANMATALNEFIGSFSLIEYGRLSPSVIEKVTMEIRHPRHLLNKTNELFNKEARLNFSEDKHTVREKIAWETFFVLCKNDVDALNYTFNLAIQSGFNYPIQKALQRTASDLIQLVTATSIAVSNGKPRKVDYTSESISFGLWLEDFLSYFLLCVDTKGTKIKLDIDKRINERKITLSTVKLRQTFFILFSNAILYTDVNEITVSVYQSNYYIEIIIDNYIPKEIQKELYYPNVSELGLSVCLETAYSLGRDIISTNIFKYPYKNSSLQMNLIY